MARTTWPGGFSEIITGTAGTALDLGGTSALRGDIQIGAILVIARSSNTNRVYFGGSDVTTASNDGIASGGQLSFEYSLPQKLDSMFITVETTGDGVEIYAVQA